MADERRAGPTELLTAGETLSGHRAIAVVDGLAVYADKDTPDHRGLVRGITAGAITAGGQARVQVYGPMAEATWSWTPGAPIFVGAEGALTQTPPTTGWLQQIAVADTATRIFIDPQPPIVLH